MTDRSDTSTDSGHGPTFSDARGGGASAGGGVVYADAESGTARASGSVAREQWIAPTPRGIEVSFGYGSSRHHLRRHRRVHLPRTRSRSPRRSPCQRREPRESRAGPGGDPDEGEPAEGRHDVALDRGSAVGA